MTPGAFLGLHGRFIAEMLRAESMIALPEYQRRVDSVRRDLLDAAARQDIHEYREERLRTWLYCSLAFNAGLAGALLWLR